MTQTRDGVVCVLGPLEFVVENSRPKKEHFWSPRVKGTWCVQGMEITGLGTVKKGRREERIRTRHKAEEVECQIVKDLVCRFYHTNKRNGPCKNLGTRSEKIS